MQVQLNIPKEDDTKRMALRGPALRVQVILPSCMCFLPRAVTSRRHHCGQDHESKSEAAINTIKAMWTKQILAEDWLMKDCKLEQNLETKAGLVNQILAD